MFYASSDLWWLGTIIAVALGSVNLLLIAVLVLAVRRLAAAWRTFVEREPGAGGRS